MVRWRRRRIKRKEIKIKNPTNPRRGRTKSQLRKKRKRKEQKKERKRLPRSRRGKQIERIRREMRGPHSPGRGGTSRAKSEPPGSRKGRIQMKERLKDH